MKKELTVHFTALVVFFASLLVLKTLFGSQNWFNLNTLPFLFGGVLGTLLVYTDHLIYVYYLRPKEKVSQQVVSLFSKSDFVKGFEIMLKDHQTSDNLTFHNARFQLGFSLFAFMVLTSTGRLLGSGLVLAFLLHLLVGMFRDYAERGELGHWFVGFPLKLDADGQRTYLVVSVLVLFILGFFV